MRVDEGIKKVLIKLLFLQFSSLFSRHVASSDLSSLFKFPPQIGLSVLTVLPFGVGAIGCKVGALIRVGMA